MREKFHRLWLVTGAHNGDGLLLVMRISSQHSLCIYARARTSEWSKRGIGWRGSGEGYERSKPEYGTGRNHDQPLSWWRHYRRLSTNAIFPFLEKRGIHFLPKMSSAPLFFLVPPPALSRLASSSLAIISARSTTKWKYEKIESCEQSTSGTRVAYFPYLSKWRLQTDIKFVS